ncbi:hypothetical protein EYF80_066907 [Liparis tanakae]|uniref:Uncharacterized protein n=1 Tax=Liparis tanakae TaxID=230148 RepID=A0A4Z2E2L5_9TELE|nr:hypothetical protein EYF80_066907 [Liparis tanakae]
MDTQPQPEEEVISGTTTSRETESIFWFEPEFFIAEERVSLKRSVAFQVPPPPWTDSEDMKGAAHGSRERRSVGFLQRWTA